MDQRNETETCCTGLVCVPASTTKPNRLLRMRPHGVECRKVVLIGAEKPGSVDEPHDAPLQQDTVYGQQKRRDLKRTAKSCPGSLGVHVHKAKEGAVACGLVLRRVVRVRDKWQNLIPVLMARVNVHRDHVDESPVRTLCQAIRLWVIRSRMAKVTRTKAQQIFHNVGDELATAVTNNHPWSSMPQDDTVKEEHGNTQCRCSCHRCSFCVAR